MSTKPVPHGNDDTYVPLRDTDPAVAGAVAGLDGLRLPADSERVAAFVVSLDRLNVVNDVLGFAAGDTVVAVAEQRLRAWAGPDAGVTRLPGARFAVLRVTDAETAELEHDANRLIAALEQPIEIDHMDISRSAGVGIATGTGGDVSGLVEAAVNAGRAVRAGGGHGVRAFDAGDRRELAQRSRLELELYGALHAGELTLAYQPEFDLRTRQVLAVEALLRWRHPELGLLRADAFIGATEQTHTFTEVVQWVIEQACGQLAAWREATGTAALEMRINVSSAQLVDGRVRQALLDGLARNRLLPAQLCVELTERMIPDDVEPLVGELEAIRAAGMSVAIDDFGTGRSTLSHLTSLPCNVIKIDRSFVSRMRSDDRSAAIVAGLLAGARALGLEVVAEGVDSEDSIRRLLALGCHRAQGHVLSEPLPPEAVVPLLRAPGDQPEPENSP